MTEPDDLTPDDKATEIDPGEAPTADGPLPTDDYQGGPASDEAATDFAEEQRQQNPPLPNSNPDGVD